MQLKKFQSKHEDFKCEHCGLVVTGTGYTNHCPKCLWSKHVDINPGDRMNDCQGMMKRVAVEAKGKSYIIVHQCQTCGYKKNNRADSADDFDSMVSLAKQINP